MAYGTLFVLLTIARLSDFQEVLKLLACTPT
jgi:hypothetical protein